MEKDDSKHIVDVDFTEDVKYIKGKPLYCKTNEVAQLLGENPSTIRFWVACFNDFLNIETSGRIRMFKEADIEKLRYIQKLLREDNLTINQVKQYCSEEDMSLIESKFKDSEPIMIQSIATAISLEVANYLDGFKESLNKQIAEEIQNSLIQQQMDLKIFQSELKESIEEKISKEIQSNMESIKGQINEMELKARERDLEIIDNLRKSMEEQKKLSEKRGFFGRLFGK